MDIVDKPQIWILDDNPDRSDNLANLDNSYIRKMKMVLFGEITTWLLH